MSNPQDKQEAYNVNETKEILRELRTEIFDDGNWSDVKAESHGLVQTEYCGQFTFCLSGKYQERQDDFAITMKENTRIRMGTSILVDSVGEAKQKSLIPEKWSTLAVNRYK